MKVNPPAAERRGRCYLLVDTPAPPPDHPGGPEPTVRIRKILPSGKTTQQIHMTGAEFRDAAKVAGYIGAIELDPDVPRLDRLLTECRSELAKAKEAARKEPEAKKPRSESAARGWETRRAKAEARESTPDPDHPTVDGPVKGRTASLVVHDDPAPPPGKRPGPDLLSKLTADPDPSFTGTEGEPSP